MKVEPIAKPVRIAPSNRWLAIAAGFIASCLLFAGCATSAGGAISEDAFGRMQADVVERNQQRYRRAEAALQARGYRFVDDEQLYATLNEDAKQHCIRRDDDDHAASRAQTDETPMSVGQPILVRVALTSRTGRPPPVPSELRVTEGDACPFFRAQTDQLDGQQPDGTTVHIARLQHNVRLARDRNGGLVVVSVSTRAVSHRSVVVQEMCNGMPMCLPDPIESGNPARVILTSTPLLRVEMVVEEEVLNFRCTGYAV